MAKSRAQKQKLVRLLEIFREKTDEGHGITTPELIEELARYGIDSERKSIYDDIATLQEMGYDIQPIREGNTYSYAYISRLFELPELKLLADAVSSSKFITEKKSDALITKIGKLTSQQNAKILKRQVLVRNRVKTRNEKIYYNVDTLHRAITLDKQVSFRYYEYTLEKDENNQPKRILKRGIKERVTSPYALTWDDENYYLISYYEKYGHMVNFRVDKMENIQIVDKKRVPVKINVHEYAKRTFGMFPGEETEVTIIVENSLIDTVYDRFGKDTIIRKYDDEHFLAHINVSVSPPFFGWVFQFNGKVKIEAPQSVRSEFVRYAKMTVKQYK